MNRALAGAWVSLSAAAAVAAPATPAHACGGLFCSASAPVNQAAEQIIFVDNGDGTITAVIQILYEGPAPEFAWVLPVAGTPEVGVSSEQALNVVKAASNPRYNLSRTFGEGCGMFSVPLSGNMLGAAGSMASNPGITILDSGTVGPYVYETILVDEALADRAQAAIDWFIASEYDLGDLGAEVLRPYLDEGMNLIAFKLSKDADAGSIRPVLLTYEASVPAIPIRPTAVAANEDMGVLVFVLSSARAIPKNYKALELNEALIDWFNPNTNYNDVVSKAADEAMGQGFVTEFAGLHATLVFDIYPSWQREMWSAFQAREFTDPFEMIDNANSFAAYDGFSDALREAVTLPDSVAFADFAACPRCYEQQAGLAFDIALFRRRLYELVIKPLIDTQALFDRRPYLTRLYTTMSAEDMTMDPVFDFNPDLANVSNVHNATQLIQCGDDGNAFAPDVRWETTLPQGGVVYGRGNGVWPIRMDSQPAALRIMQYGTKGDGEVIEDRSEMIATMLKERQPTRPADAGSGGTTGSMSGSAGTKASSAGAGGSNEPTAKPGKDDEKPGAAMTNTVSAPDGGCNAGGARGLDLLSPMLLAGLGLLGRRRALRNTNVRREP